MHAFAMVREAIAWLDRTLPLSAHFPRGSIFREDRQPVPAEALREVILNAVMHRDCSRASSYVAIAVFDDRIEVRSVGDFPTGIRAEMLSGDHPSILRNPLIAGAFHRTGAVEVWGRGINRVIEACRARGVAPPQFSEQAGVVTVTFMAAVGPEAQERATVDEAGTQLGAGPELTERQREILRVLGRKPAMPLREIGAALEAAPSDRRLREELLHLKRLGLVEQSGHGRGSIWSRRKADGE
jgi:ATP-dependent DNA helicase RecG